MTTLLVSIDLSAFGYEDLFQAELAADRVTAIYGPSGSGKTRLLRAIAGLDRHPNTEIIFNSQPWQSAHHFVPSRDRDLAMVFQESSLFDHMTVRENIQFAERRVRHIKRSSISRNELVHILNLEHLLSRPSHALSVGEKQRAAIARAISAQPDLLLMDEPLSALDSGHKAEILPLLEQLCQRSKMSILYVTHSTDEVARLADDLLLMERGRCLVCGDASEVMARLDLSLSTSDQAAALISAKVVRYQAEFGLVELDTEVGPFYLAANKHLSLQSVLRLNVFARDVSLSLQHNDQSSILNQVNATILESKTLDEAHLIVKLQAKRGYLLAKITRKSWHKLGLHPGSNVVAQVKSVALV